MVVVKPPSMVAWEEGEAATIAAVSAMNLATAGLVEVIAAVDAGDGWHGWGIRSLEHWVQWKANVSARRAEGLVLIARRRHELPCCYGRFVEGRFTEDTMVRLARRVPAERDSEMAETAAGLLVCQLDRILASLPLLPPPGEDPAPKPDPERFVRTRRRPDGWLHGEFCLPPR